MSLRGCKRANRRPPAPTVLGFWLFETSMKNKIIVIRPGALGDVLVTRGALRWLKTAFPAFDIDLLAPGERGAFLCRPGWADRAWDWERSAFSRLFSEDGGEPPGLLRDVFAGARLVTAFVDFRNDAGGAEHFSRRVREAAPSAAVQLSPPVPPAGSDENILPWLCGQAYAGALAAGLAADGAMPDMALCLEARIPIELPAGLAVSAPYAVLHPGSGSARKNWPLANFAALGGKLRQAGLSLVVTSGEADGGLGEGLAATLPGASHLHEPSLSALAGVLAGAALYVGNDSGVSHLAAAVRGVDGRFPCSAVIFGSSDRGLWAPWGSLVLSAGEGMAALSAEAAWADICAAFPLQTKAFLQ